MDGLAICPICGSEARIYVLDNNEFVYCPNGKCPELVSEHVNYTIPQWIERHKMAKETWRKIFIEEPR